MKGASKVAVGLSGGIDSSLAAMLLKQAGHDVVGLTMKIWDGSIDLGEKRRSGCYGPGEAQDIQEAAVVAARLGIKHYVISLVDEYKAEVLEYFRCEYLAGRTPNPCVRCNQQLKFGFLIDRAREQGVGFDYFATGHYARTSFNQESGRHLLLKGRDQRKDLSYFLARLCQAQLAQLIFPLGELTKEDVRHQAAELGWSDLLAKPESQDFMECQDYGAIFKPEERRPGPMVDQNGNMVGQHRGLVHYTIGQRRGVTAGGYGEPQYVVGIDSDKNILEIGGQDRLYSTTLIANDLNWIAWVEPPKQEVRIYAKIRLAHRAAAATLRVAAESGEVEVVFDQKQRAITPGQIVVFYKDDLVLGSAVIKKGIS
jgi:tRNA-specific 2-thiouridylase